MDTLDSPSASTANGMMSAASNAADRATEVLRGSSQQLRDQAAKASEMAVAYAREEPLKALLIAAATGAVLMGVLSMMSGSSD